MKEKSIPESGGLQRGTWMAEIQVQVPATSRHAKKCALSRVRIVAAKTGCKRDRLLKERSACWPVEPESHGFFFRLDSPLSRSGPPAPLRRNDTPKFGTGTGNRTEDRNGTVAGTDEAVEPILRALATLQSSTRLTMRCPAEEMGTLFRMPRCFVVNSETLCCESNALR